MTSFTANASRRDFWTSAFRFIVFTLAASSIWCLLAEFYGPCSMRIFTLVISPPALLVLTGLALIDRAIGSQRLWRAVVVRCVAGFLAAIAYDVFRLPFVFARPLQIEAVVPPLNLFKVYPRFGAMILGQSVEQIFTPYPNVFGIHVTGTIFAVTLAAHLVFGAALGLLAFRLGRLCRTAVL